MPLWAVLEPILIKFAVSEVVAILVRAGMISAFTGSLVKTADDLKIAVSGIKFYHEPIDFPSAPPQVQTPNNLGEQKQP
jgi:hypothetical protein